MERNIIGPNIGAKYNVQDDMTDIYAYKILRAAEYDVFTQHGTFTGSPVDIQDGYIHLSLTAQLQATLDKHYKDAGELALIEVELSACQDKIKFEISRGGAKFPHLYGALYKDAVRRVWTLRAGETGRYALPKDLATQIGSRK